MEPGARLGDAPTWRGSLKASGQPVALHPGPSPPHGHSSPPSHSLLLLSPPGPQGLHGWARKAEIKPTVGLWGVGLGPDVDEPPGRPGWSLCTEGRRDHRGAGHSAVFPASLPTRCGPPAPLQLWCGGPAAPSAWRGPGPVRGSSPPTGGSSWANPDSWERVCRGCDPAQGGPGERGGCPAPASAAQAARDLPASDPLPSTRSSGRPRRALPLPDSGSDSFRGVLLWFVQAFCVPQALYREQLGPRRWRQPSRASWLMRGRMGPGEAAGDGVATALAWMDRTHSASGLTTCLIPRLGPFTARGPAGVGEQTPERRRQGRVRRGLCPYPHPEPRGSGVSACSSGAPSSGTCSG
nr:collagen alpha-3(IX) chain-like [Globicephala melas]